MSNSLVLKESAHHRVSPTKRQRESEQEDADGDGKPIARKRPPARSARGSGKSSGRGSGSDSGGAAHATLASTLSVEDCELVYSTDRVKFVTHRKHPSVLIKVAGRKRHVVEELEQEILVYDQLIKLPWASNAIPKYYGGSKLLGTPLLCLGYGGPTLDDIGVANASTLQEPYVYLPRMP